MYHTFFGLTELAFSIAVNPRYLYMSQQHKEALAHLLYGVTGGGFVMLTGEVGTGKTTIIRCLLEQMPENTDIAIVMNPMSNVPELLKTICDELGAHCIQEEPSVKDLTDTLHRFLLNNHTRGRNTVLLIDEAQLLSTQALEQVRLLTNLETTTQKLLHIILVGQPELKKLLSKPELRQLSQRITARFHLTPLTFAETQAYIRHRLKVAGLPEGRSPFPYAIVKRIHAFTGGIPRLINVICERCLIGAYASNKARVDNSIFNAARKEVIGGLDSSPSAQQSLWIKAALVIGCAATLSAALYFNMGSHHKNSGSGVAAISSASSASNASSSAASSESDISIRNYHDAEDIFFEHLELPLAAETRPCGRNLKIAQQCAKVSLHTWTDIKELNRPVILVMSTPEKFSTYLVLIGLHEENALILNAQRENIVVPLSKVGRNWTGEAVYLWKRPPGFSETLLLGDTSPTVAWVAQQFAKLDKQKEPLSDDLFSLALHERIKIFQRMQGINADGNINEQTLLKVNELVGADQILLTDFSEATLKQSTLKQDVPTKAEHKELELKEPLKHVPTP